MLISGGHLLVGSTLAVACRPGGPTLADPAPTPGEPTLGSPGSATTTVPPTTTSPPVWSGADFAELDRFLADTNGEAFLLMEEGTVIHEWTRTDRPFGRDIASAQKSVLSLLVGRAIADGHFTLDTTIDELLGRQWTDHGVTETISVRHLLTMTSGLDDAYAVVAAPGTTWIYSGAFAALFDVLTTTTGRELNDLAGEWLFDPVGAGGARYYARRSGNAAPIGLWAGTADLVAIGHAVVQGAVPNLPAGWLEQSFTSNAVANEAYGFLWWLNGRPSYMLPGPIRAVRQGPLIPAAPADLVGALGKDDQKLYVSRDMDLVVARLGGKAVPTSQSALSSFDNDLWTRLMQLRG